MLHSIDNSSENPAASGGLRGAIFACYGLELAPSLASHRTYPFHLINIIGCFCHDLSYYLPKFCISFVVFSAICYCQVVREQAPGPNEVLIRAVSNVAEGSKYHLKGAAQLQTSESLVTADEIDYDESTGEAEARGNVHFKHFERGEELWAERVEYNVKEQTGKFYEVHGTSPPRVDWRPGLLTTSSPFYFQGKWAERLKEKYVLHDGMITNCRLPKPWWTLRGPKFDIIPGQRAIARNSVFRVRGFPLFYTPAFYKSLEEQPRRSGLLTPNIGNSSRRGKMIGIGYYWAINRSYDAAYRTQYFTQRGFAHHVDVRGKPTNTSDFNAIIYGVNDRGQLQSNGERGPKEGGYIITFEGRTALPHGFSGQAEVNYLSSLRFRQAFTESFNEAIISEVHSSGFVGKHWNGFAFNAVMMRGENVQKIGDYDSELGKYKEDTKISIRKLPQVEFSMRDREVLRYRELPLWLSFESSAGLLGRSQTSYKTSQFVERFDLQPHVSTAFRWKGLSLIPGFSLRATHYGQHLEGTTILSQGVDRFSREASLELIPPSIERTFNGPKWLGDKVKHVIEPRASFRHVGGIDDFEKFVRFDETELITNTTEAEISITNRVYSKRGGDVNEILSWRLSQRRYFDTDFGGAVIAGQRNVILTSAQLTPFAFFSEPRNYSPVVSEMRINRWPLGIEWTANYDPLRQRLVGGSLTADYRFSDIYISLGHNHVNSDVILSPHANQFRGLLVIGNDNRRGWNAAFSAIYDPRQGVMQYATTQVTYNTDCCGISVQYRRFQVGTRNENQFRMSFQVANIGSFGTLKRQERLF